MQLQDASAQQYTYSWHEPVRWRRPARLTRCFPQQSLLLLLSARSGQLSLRIGLHEAQDPSASLLFRYILSCARGKPLTF